MEAIKKNKIIFMSVKEARRIKYLLEKLRNDEHASKREEKEINKIVSDIEYVLSV